jgi:hypothetical protein
MTTRDELRAEKALQGMEFPASKTELIDYATERSATAKTLQALEALPDRRSRTRTMSSRRCRRNPKATHPEACTGESGPYSLTDRKNTDSNRKKVLEYAQ